MSAIQARLRASSRMAAIHLAGGLLAVGLLAVLVLGVWFPYPYREISGGQRLFFLMVAVDVVCGPLLTLVLFDPAKARWKWHVDIAIILTLQLGAMAYGLHSIAKVRPVWLAFENDRFQVVRADDVEVHRLHEAAPAFALLSWTGPRLVGVKLLDKSDPEYLDSVMRSMSGESPAYRPSRWVPYETQQARVRKALQPLDRLSSRWDVAQALPQIEKQTGLKPSELGYLPLVQNAIDDWIVIIGREDGLPKTYWHVDGW